MHEALMASCANVVGTAFTDGTQRDVTAERKPRQPQHGLRPTLSRNSDSREVAGYLAAFLRRD